MIDIHQLKGHIYDVVGALYEVHKELGAGLNEFCYQEGFQIQLEESGIQYEKELTFFPTYHGKAMSTHYRVDLHDAWRFGNRRRGGSFGAFCRRQSVCRDETDGGRSR